MAAGIHVPEGRKCFSGLTIQDNLLVGGYLIRGKKLLQNLRRAYDLFPILEQRRNQYAGTLSGGEQQMLAICRGLMSDPKLMLLDEPSLGLAPLVMRQVFDLVEQINSGITILLVEQNARNSVRVIKPMYWRMGDRYLWEWC